MSDKIEHVSLESIAQRVTRLERNNQKYDKDRCV
jgi:hypothetical protein